MKIRTFWLDKIKKEWRRPVLWLSGIRRVGKTCLCQSLPDIEYFDCELPRVRRLIDDPQSFLEDLRGLRVVLDELGGRSSKDITIATEDDRRRGGGALVEGEYGAVSALGHGPGL